MTPSGIEPATFRLVAQYLNQLRHCVLHGWRISFSLLNQYSDASWILDFVAFPKYKLVKPAGLNGNVGGNRFGISVDTSNILTELFHGSSQSTRENSWQIPNNPARPTSFHILLSFYRVLFNAMYSYKDICFCENSHHYIFGLPRVTTDIAVLAAVRVW
jgi:hypothetical protein